MVWVKKWAGKVMSIVMLGVDLWIETGQQMLFVYNWVGDRRKTFHLKEQIKATLMLGMFF